MFDMRFQALRSHRPQRARCVRNWGTSYASAFGAVVGDASVPPYVTLRPLVEDVPSSRAQALVIVRFVPVLVKVVPTPCDTSRQKRA